MKKENLPEYKNFSDLSLITTLRYFGIREESIGRDEQGKTYFNFFINKETEETIKKYYSGKLVVEPQAFFLHLKAVKGRIYSQEI